jgi:hypothetical protein
MRTNANASREIVERLHGGDEYVPTRQRQRRPALAEWRARMIDTG